MKLTQWSFRNLSIPMLENENGELFCTSKVLCDALGIDSKTLLMVCARHADELSGLRVTLSGAKEAIDTHRSELRVGRIRHDMRLFSEDDMIAIALLSRSTVSKEFRKHLRMLIKENATRGYVSRERHEALEAKFDDISGRFGDLEDLVRSVMPSLNTAASAAGSALAAHRGTKPLRNN